MTQGVAANSGGARAVEAQQNKESIFIPTQRFVKIPLEVFESSFTTALKINTDEKKDSGYTPIASIHIGDCITIFAFEYDEKNELDRIIGYHAQNKTTKEEIEDWLKEVHDQDDSKIFFYIIGGDEETTSEDGLLSNICAGIKSHMENNDCILEMLTNIKGEYKYVNAAITMEGLLFFCTE